MTIAIDNEPVPNLPLLRKHLDWVREQAGRGGNGDWDQAVWVFLNDEPTVTTTTYAEVPLCNTTRCFAGNVVLDAGAQFMIDPGGALEHVVAEPEDDQRLVWEGRNDGVRLTSVEARARRLLGLTVDESVDLFYETDTYEEIEDVVRRIFRRAGEEL